MADKRYVSKTDVWADITSDHLNATEKRVANNSKENLIEKQRNRLMLRAPFESGEIDPKELVIDSLSGLNNFLNRALHVADKSPTVIILETKGASNCWDEMRKDIDGPEYVKNDETAGVTVITMNVSVRNEENMLAFIDAKKIVENDLGGRPNLPRSFLVLLRHKQVMVMGEKVLRHIKRLENSFFKETNKILYTTIQDLTDRYKAHKISALNLKIWEFESDPNRNEGVINNFHDVFEKETFFRNPYAALADWSGIDEIRESQVLHALNKSYFSGILVEQILRYFESWNMSLSVMGNLYPKCEVGKKIDFRLRDFSQFDIIPPKWFKEQHWPCGPVEITGEPDRDRIHDVEYPGDEAMKAKSKRNPNPPPSTGKRKHGEDTSEEEDDDDRDQRKANENETLQRSAKIVQLLRSNYSVEKINKLMGPDKHDNVLFASNVIQSFGEAKNAKLVKMIYDHYAGMWPEDRKERLINTLARNGFFRRSGTGSPIQATTHLRINGPSATLFLQMGDVPAKQITEHVARMHPSIQRDVITNLENHLELAIDERKAELQSCEFYVRNESFKYLIDDEKIESLIEKISTTCNIAPGDAFFRHRRAGFIDSIIRLGREGLVSANNAALMISRHVGDDLADKKDAVLMCVRWPKVAEALHGRWGLITTVPQFNHCDRNLLRDIGCRQNFHVEKGAWRHKEFCIIRDQRSLDDAITYFSREDLIIVETRANKDPRSFSPLPSFISFRAPGLDLFGFFPHQIDDELKDSLLAFLGNKTLFVRDPEAIRRALNVPKQSFKHVHAGVLAMKYGFGRGNDAMASFVWDRRFCILTRGEWVTDPLTRDQETHLAYELNLLDGLLGKIGLSVVEQSVKSALK